MHDIPRHLLLAVLVGGLVLAPMALSAQDEAPLAEQDMSAAPGISTLVFLLGAGAIIIVGGAMIARDNFESDGDAGS